MSTRDFVLNCKAERDQMLALYSSATSETSVSAALASAELSSVQRQHVLAAIDGALTDAFYTMLMGLAGAAALGADQQNYRLLAENGEVVGHSEEGDLEAIAFEIFHGT